MRYIIKRDTKEHQAVGDAWQLYDKENYYIVQADSEGWIAHTGTVCPLPDNHLHEIKDRDGGIRRSDEPQLWDWYKDGTPSDITHYRPILTEKVQEPEPIPAPHLWTSVTPDLLDALKLAHAQAQQIPDLEAELREVLAGMGYDLVARSPFVEPEPAVETPQEDMTDWRNWRDNDLIMLKDGIKSGNAIIAGEKYQITHKTKDGFWIDTKMRGSIHIRGRVGDFRFHSRPKGEK